MKLTDAQKQNMYAMRSAGITLEEIGKAYGKSSPEISRLLKKAGVRRPYLRHAPTYGADNEVVTALVENRLNAVAAVFKPHLQELKALSEKFIKTQVAEHHNLLPRLRLRENLEFYRSDHPTSRTRQLSEEVQHRLLLRCRHLASTKVCLSPSLQAGQLRPKFLKPHPANGSPHAS